MPKLPLVRPAIYEKDGFFVRLWKHYAPRWVFEILYKRRRRKAKIVGKCGLCGTVLWDDKNVR